MSKHEWKPGDVAMTQFGLSVVISGRRCEHYDKAPHWHHVTNGGWGPIDGHPSARPLVVIDPEDREQVERLDDLIWATVNGDAQADLAAALREFANPTQPKPDEPTGLGAVVEDAAGNRWVLYTSTDSTAPWCDGATSCEWDEIAAVRVLSEGVSND